MQAIIKTGGKQYRVQEGDIIKVEKLEGEVGDEIILDEILMAKKGGEESEVLIGSPNLTDFKVKGEILEQGRGKKIVVFTYKRRKGFKKMKGHRQSFTAIEVKEILGGPEKKEEKETKPLPEVETETEQDEKE